MQYSCVLCRTFDLNFYKSTSNDAFNFVLNIANCHKCCTEMQILLCARIIYLVSSFRIIILILSDQGPRICNQTFYIPELSLLKSRVDGILFVFHLLSSGEGKQIKTCVQDWKVFWLSDCFMNFRWLRIPFQSSHWWLSDTNINFLLKWRMDDVFLPCVVFIG